MQSHLKLTLLLTLGISLNQSATQTVRSIFTTLADQQGFFLLGFIGTALNYWGYAIGSLCTSIFISLLGLKRCLILGVLGQTSIVIAALVIYYVNSEMLVYVLVLFLTGLSGIAQGILETSYGLYMTKMIDEEKRALMLGILFAGGQSGAVWGTVATYGLLMVMSTSDVLIIHFFVVVCGALSFLFLADAPDTDKGQYQKLVGNQSGEPGVTALICFWSYIGVMTVYMVSILPHLVRVATNSNEQEEMLHVTSILFAVTAGRFVGALFAGYINKSVGESVVVGISSAALILGLGFTLYLTTASYSLYWIPVGFWVGINEGMSQTVGMKLASILSIEPQGMFKKTRASFGFTTTVGLLSVSYLIMTVPTWSILTGIIVINLFTAGFTIKGHQDHLYASWENKEYTWDESDEGIEMEISVLDKTT